MATRLQTIYRAFPTLASLTNNTLTNLTQITIQLPNITGTPTFRGVTARISMDDIITATGGTITTKTFSLRLGAAAYTTVANANALTNSGENLSLFWAVDFTSHFNSNWSGTSMTCDFQVTVNQSTGTTLGMVNVCVLLEITYEYDDTASTQIKSVLIPLNAPTGTIPTTITTYDTFPALDTYLPEASKTYRDILVIVQGNEQRGAVTTDHTLTVTVGTTDVVSGSYEGSLQSDRWFRFIALFNSIATNTTHNFRLTSSVARNNHPQCYAIVTYEFDPATTTRLIISQMLPMEIVSPMGGTASSDAQRASREMWIPEPGTINNAKIAFYLFWSQVGPMAGLNMRLGTGSYTSYTDGGSTYGGGCGAMNRNDSAFTLARGRNSLQMDVYRTDTSDLGWGLGGFWLVNYQCDVPSAGFGAASRTIVQPLYPMGTGAAAALRTETPDNTPTIPEANYFLSAVGLRLEYMSSGTSTPTSINVLVERLAAEGGQQWESAYIDALHLDSECGASYQWAQTRTLFQRWPGDTDTSRMDIETSRRWRAVNGLNTAGGFSALDLIFTYHTITYTAADSITGFTGTVTLGLHRSATGEKVLETTRSGDGAFSFTWYDNTEEMFVSANDGTNAGRSDDTLAA